MNALAKSSAGCSQALEQWTLNLKLAFCKVVFYLTGWLDAVASLGLTFAGLNWFGLEFGLSLITLAASFATFLQPRVAQPMYIPSWQLVVYSPFGRTWSSKFQAQQPPVAEFSDFPLPPSGGDVAFSPCLTMGLAQSMGGTGSSPCHPGLLAGGVRPRREGHDVWRGRCRVYLFAFLFGEGDVNPAKSRDCPWGLFLICSRKGYRASRTDQAHVS